jgi:hypothetical protein
MIAQEASPGGFQTHNSPINFKSLNKRFDYGPDTYAGKPFINEVA